ncbi:MAG TPA: MarR family transcriptional regulator [Sphingomonadaceae bacterium]|nr:MarR family transcriptional regulator [Sphingomonadaceae bacterium]
MADDEFTLERSLGAQIKRTQRALSRALAARLAPHDVPIGMWYFLRALWEEDGLSQKEISDRVGATAATATEQLRNMEARGLVRRARSAEDRRRIHFFLEPDGEALRSLLALPQDVETRATAGFSVGEVAFLRMALGRLRTNLAAIEGEQDGDLDDPDDN